ncbi:zinc ribbon domain-containing protein [Schnuerera ultunensis]|uniref:zinc ribbon domain-containing protein n=1 Tax=Schnuerera ultunensis TaxID=45497 RepID=UPI0009DEF07E
MCSNCNYKNEKTKDLSIRQWTCPECGTYHNRDINASINTLNQGLKDLESVV